MERLPIAFVGEVDHGKSTLIGRLLLDTGSLSATREATVRGGAPLAHLMDQLGREQDEDITVNTAQAFMRYKDRDFALVDAPGHEAFLQHMLTGASISEAAVLLIDATEGVQDETRRHALLVDLLGIRQVVAVVNKVDALSEPEKAFQALLESVASLAAQFEFDLLDTVPASALSGAQVTAPGFDWFTGPTVLEALLKFRSHGSDGEHVRFAVQDLYTFTGETVVAGRVESGCISPGDVLTAAPEGLSVKVRELIDFPAQEQDMLCAPATGNLILAGEGSEDIHRGQVLYRGKPELRRSPEVTGRIFCLGPSSIRAGDRLIFRCATQEAAVTIASISDGLDSGTLLPTDTPDVLEPFALGVARLKAEQDLVVEDPFDTLPLGRFVLEDDSGPVALGMVLGNDLDVSRTGRGDGKA